MSTAASARQQSEVFILGSLAGPVATGIYSLSQKVAAPMNLLAQSARLAIFPELARTSRETDAVTTRTLVYGSALALFIGLLAIFIFYLISDKLLTILFGAAFAGAGTVASVLLISHLLYAVGAIWLSVVIIRIGPAPIAASNIVALMVQVAVSVWLAPTLGALGAALANLGALLAWWGCLAVAIRTALKQR
jgi:O-antigen/teichoic acid export membrane protein